MTILDLLEQDGIQMRRVANTRGGEWCGPCPRCGGRDRFRVQPNYGERGFWWCKQEDISGDDIQYLREFREMSFHDACSFLGREPGPSSNLVKKENKPTWEPKENIFPDEIWQGKSEALVDWCHKELMSDTGKDALEYLKTERGLSEKTIKFRRLGWNPKDVWPVRKAWGLPDGVNKEGKPIKKIYLPKGIVIPCFIDEQIQKVKIRLQKPKEDTPHYLPIPGGYTGPHVLGNNHKIFVIVESELCGILLHQEIGNLAGVIVLGSAYIRPDKKIIDILKSAELLLIALDNEPHKKDNTGAKQSWNFWLKHFSQAKRWCPIEGKDPSEMWGSGKVNLREWVQVGINKYSLSLENELLSMYESEFNDIAGKYESRALDRLNKTHPALYANIEQTEDELNKVWDKTLEGKATTDNFRAALSRWHGAQIKGIEEYKTRAVNN